MISPGRILQSFRFFETQKQLTWVLSSRLEEQSRMSCHLEISTSVKTFPLQCTLHRRRTEPWKHQKDRWTAVPDQNNHCRENDNLRRHPVRRVLMSIFALRLWILIDEPSESLILQIWLSEHSYPLYSIPSKRFGTVDYIQNKAIFKMSANVPTRCFSERCNLYCRAFVIDQLQRSKALTHSELDWMYYLSSLKYFKSVQYLFVALCIP